MLKNAFMYILALTVLLAPAIILGWIGWSLLDWPGLIIGVIIGLAIFAFSMNKIVSQEATEAASPNESDLDLNAVKPMQEAAHRDS